MKKKISKKYQTLNKSLIQIVKMPGKNIPGIAKVLKGGNLYPGYLTVKEKEYYIINEYGDAVSIFSKRPIPSNVGEVDYASFKGLCFTIDA